MRPEQPSTNDNNDRENNYDRESDADDRAGRSLSARAATSSLLKNISQLQLSQMKATKAPSNGDTTQDAAVSATCSLPPERHPLRGRMPLRLHD